MTPMTTAIMVMAMMTITMAIYQMQCPLIPPPRSRLRTRRSRMRTGRIYLFVCHCFLDWFVLSKRLHEAAQRRPDVERIIPQLMMAIRF